MSIVPPVVTTAVACVPSSTTEPETLSVPLFPTPYALPSRNVRQLDDPAAEVEKGIAAVGQKVPGDMFAAGNIPGAGRDVEAVGGDNRPRRVVHNRTDPEIKDGGPVRPIDGDRSVVAECGRPLFQLPAEFKFPPRKMVAASAKPTKATDNKTSVSVVVRNMANLPVRLVIRLNRILPSPPPAARQQARQAEGGQGEGRRFGDCCDSHFSQTSPAGIPAICENLNGDVTGGDATQGENRIGFAPSDFSRKETAGRRH